MHTLLRGRHKAVRSALATLREWVARIRGAFHPSRRDGDVEEELRLHLELAAEDARRAPDARESHARAARVSAGGLAQAMEAMRDQRGLPWLDDLARDLGHGFHLLRRSPAFAGAAVVSLALGIGANTAVFSLADALLLRPLPVPRPDDVLTTGFTDRFGGGLVASYRDYVDIRDRSASFDGLVAFTSVGAAFATGTETSPRLRIGMVVSGNVFRVMGVTPHLGRDFRPEEDQVPGRDAVVILGHDFWQQLGADAAILGRTVRLNGIAFTVIGVAPAGFTGLDQYSRFEFYAPLMIWPRLTTNASTAPLEARDFRELAIKGRLASGVTIAKAQAELSGIAKELEQASPEANRSRSLAVRTELQNRIAQAPPVAMLLAMLSALAGAVLLVACANVAGLLASRAPVRAREIALRMAIGAGRFRVVRQLITESVLVASIGGVLGLGVGYAGVALFRQIRFPSDLPIGPAFELDRRALAVSLVAALMSAVLFGLAPAFRSARADLNAVMKVTDAAGTGRGRSWGRAVLVSGQVAVAVILLVLATFVYRGFQQRLDSGPGFRTDHVLLMRFDPGLLGYNESDAHRFFEQVAERARSVPGVRSATLTSYVPMDGMPPRLTMVPEGFELRVGTESITIGSATIGERYFETLGLSILRGRGFHATDTSEAPRVAIVNEQVAQHYWPGQDPIGKRFRLNDSRGPWVEIVGLARNAKYAFLTEPPREFIYLPYKQRPPQSMVLMAESAGDPSALVAPLRDVVARLDANQPIYNVRSLEELYQIRAVASLNVISRLIGAMGIIGLLLAIVGLYGLVAYAVSRRTREIGIRMAVGAGRAEVLRMVLRQGLVLTIVGLGVGLVGSVGAARALGAIFIGGPGGDHRTDLVGFVLVAAAVLAATLVAAYVPARRAARIDPTEALRYE